MATQDTQSKPWGSTRTTELGHAVHLDLCEINKGGYSSLHMHEYKVNHFVVEKGCLRVYDFVVGAKGQAIRLQRDLPAGKSVYVMPRNFHQFYAVEDTVLYELYWTHDGRRIDTNDIVRISENGCGDFVEPSEGQVEEWLKAQT